MTVTLHAWCGMCNKETEHDTGLKCKECGN